MPEPEWAPFPDIPAPCSCDAPCPPPTWPPTYQLNASTIIQPCNYSGYYDYVEGWGLLSFDWNNAKDVWSENPRTATNCSEMLVEQARRVKAVNPHAKVFVYRCVLCAVCGCAVCECAVSCQEP